MRSGDPHGAVCVVIEEKNGAFEGGQPADRCAEAVVELAWRQGAVTVAEKLDEDVDGLITRSCRPWLDDVPIPGGAFGLPKPLRSGGAT
jgi:hypothetical protein